MAKITYIEPSGDAREIEVEPGYSVMEGAYNRGLKGIVAECGGAAACATCHVYIEGDWAERLARPGDNEEAMLFMAEERRASSRLSCQIKVTDALDGLIVKIAKN